jgi:hypothetical protein
MFGPSFAAGLGGASFLTTWPAHAANTENGITISASSETNPAYLGHDGTSSPWIASTGVGAWWQVQFESFRRVTSVTLTISTNTNVFDFQGSNDGVNFTTLASVSSNGTPTSVPSDNSWIFFRLLCTNASIGNAQFSEATFVFSEN